MTALYPIKKHIYWGLFLSMICLWGCTPYPPPSTGGYASHYYLKQYAARKPNCPCGPYLQKYGLLRTKLNQLYTSNAARCYTARMKQMDRLAQQIAEEIMAGLFQSATIDMHLLENNIQTLWPLQNIRGCPKIKNDQYWQILKARIQ